MKVDDWTSIMTMTTHSFFHTEGQETYQPLIEIETYKPISNYKVGHFPQFKSSEVRFRLTMPRLWDLFSFMSLGHKK